VKWPNMEIQFKSDSEVYIVVGGMSTIGQRLDLLLTGAGATVYNIDIPQKQDIHIRNQDNFFECNPLELEELERIAQTLNQSVSGLICLSGIITHFGSVLDLTPDQWNEVYNISFKSCYNACKAFLPLLMKSKSASVVNMSSGLAFGGQANYGPYTNAKSSVISLSKTLATELAPNIRVNTVAPGAVDTAFIYDENGETRFDKNSYNAITPLGTMAKPEEIAHVIAYLLSNGASHITGQCIHVNGGAMMC